MYNLGVKEILVEEKKMSFDFSRYPNRNVFPEEIKSELIYKNVLPNNYQQDKVEKVDGEILYDFGVESIGFFNVKVKGKGKIRLDYGEWLGEIYDRYEEYMPCWYESPVDNITVDSTDFQTINVNGRRTLRYLRISVVEGQVEILNPTLKTVEAKNPYDGNFYCSDQRVNDIYEISKRTTRLCMQEFVEDGIKRDGLCWITDSRVSALCNYNTFGKYKSTKSSLYQTRFKPGNYKEKMYFSSTLNSSKCLCFILDECCTVLMSL